MCPRLDENNGTTLWHSTFKLHVIQIFKNEFTLTFSSRYDQKFIVYDSTFSYKGNKTLSLVTK